jgi:flavin reductase (DIM6/NTAB) family NADH-FMN oxidoreductase RutF
MIKSEWTDAHECDQRVFRSMLGSFMTGVTVIATRDASGGARAFTANSFTSVSLDPPLILVCLAKSASSLDVFAKAQHFSVNILSERQKEVATAFASRGAAKDEALAALEGANPPILESSLSTLCCTYHNMVDAGDHVILIGQVVRFRSGSGQPLGYFRGNYVKFGLAVSTLEELASAVSVGGLLEQDGRVVLMRRPASDRWEVPTIPLRPGEGHTTAIRALFSRLGVSAAPSFLYSIFKEEEKLQTTMIFSVDAVEPAIDAVLPDGTEVRAFSEHEKPWNLVDGLMMQGMLVRFFRERASGNFGLYFDTADGGRIAPIGGKARHWTEWLPAQSHSPSRQTA